MTCVASFQSLERRPPLAYPRPERKLLHLVIVMLVAGSLLLAMYLGARRFEKKQRELGRWDQYGPLEESEPPPNAGAFGRARSMWERLEVVGQWKGRVLRRRQPNEKP